VAFAAFHAENASFRINDSTVSVDLRGHEQWILDGEGLILECHGHMDDAEFQRQLHEGVTQ
jgi:hypothetical protein